MMTKLSTDTDRITALQRIRRLDDVDLIKEEVKKTDLIGNTKEQREIADRIANFMYKNCSSKSQEREYLITGYLYNIEPELLRKAKFEKCIIYAIEMKLKEIDADTWTRLLATLDYAILTNETMNNLYVIKDGKIDRSQISTASLLQKASRGMNRLH